MTIMRDIKRSDLIKQLGYDEETRTLHIFFKNGGSGTYDDVPPEIDDEIRRLETDERASIGKFYLANIRGKFAWTPTPRRGAGPVNILAAG